MLLALAWFSRRVLLLAFSGMLIALIFTSLVNQLRRLFPIKQGLGVALVVTILLGLGALTGYLLAPGLISEFSQLADQLPKSAQKVAEFAERSPIYKQVSRSLPEMRDALPSAGNALTKVKQVFNATLETVAGFVLLAFVALFLAANPRLYQQLALNLVPPKYRPDGEEILGKVIHTLKYWLLGQLISMAIIGLLVGVSFALCGLPVAASLGVLAGIGEFVPFVGPFLAAVPALVLAFAESGKLFLIVLGVYFAIQFLEGHFVMPLVQRRTVDLPPVLTLLVVFFMGNAFGLLGMFVAAPLTAVALVLIEEIYLRRVLKDSRPLLERG